MNYRGGQGKAKELKTKVFES